MATSITIWQRSVPSSTAVDRDRTTLGKAPDNDVVIDWDSKVSRLHAVIERVGGRWCVRDLSSSNGTFVNGERIWAERPLEDGDELRLGETRVVFHADDSGNDVTETEVGAPPPELTSRERDVLIALCRPLLSGDIFTEPSSIREIAAALVVSEAAVKQHLTHLYDKFAIVDGDRRRVRLANDTVRRGVVTITDLRTA